MYHASENSKHRTGDKLWGTSCEVKPVPWPRGALVGISPPNKAPSPKIEIWNFMNQCNFANLNVKPPLHKRKAPLLTTFWRRFCVKPSVPWKWRCGCKCDLTEQESICYTNQGCSANKQIMGCWGRSHKSSHFKTALNHFKTKHEKGVGRPLPIEATATQSGNCSWFAAKSSRIFPLLAV